MFKRFKIKLEWFTEQAEVICNESLTSLIRPQDETLVRAVSCCDEISGLKH